MRSLSQAPHLAYYSMYRQATRNEGSRQKSPNVVKTKNSRVQRFFLFSGVTAISGVSLESHGKAHF